MCVGWGGGGVVCVFVECSMVLCGGVVQCDVCGVW